MLGRAVCFLFRVGESSSSPSLPLSQFPRSIIFAYDRIQRRFLWSGQDANECLNLLAWISICKPYDEGGLFLLRKREGKPFCHEQAKLRPEAKESETTLRTPK